MPGNLQLDDYLVVHAAANYEGVQRGAVSVYYTDALLQTTILRVKQDMAAEADAFYTNSQAHLRQAIINQGIGTVSVIIALAGCLMVLLRIFVLKPVNAIAVLADQLADFDLTNAITTQRRDEIGKLFSALARMVQSFKNVLGQVQRSGIQVTSSSTELSATAKQQEATMAMQMDSIQNVVNAVQDISTLATDLATTMRQVAAMSQKTADFASSGQTDLAHMQEAMQQMEKASVSISNRLQTINEKADNITTVVTTVKSSHN